MGSVFISSDRETTVDLEESSSHQDKRLVKDGSR